jgi:hypothetical protein
MNFNRLIQVETEGDKEMKWYNIMLKDDKALSMHPKSAFDSLGGAWTDLVFNDQTLAVDKGIGDLLMGRS